MKRRNIGFSRQILNMTQKENAKKTWSLLPKSYFACRLLPQSFYLFTFFNLSRSLYTNQSGLLDINICFDSEKPVISF